MVITVPKIKRGKDLKEKSENLHTRDWHLFSFSNHEETKSDWKNRHTHWVCTENPRRF